MEAVALFSFTASEADELSFHRGDVLKVTEMDDDSCWFTAEIRGKRGFVPENYISLLPYPWFAGRISRVEAEKRLRWQDAGVFLVRESESAPGEFSVSVSYGERVEHFRVLEGGGQYSIWDECFCSLNRLVDFYRTHSIGAEKVVLLRDAPSSPKPPAPPGRNPYPNPYRTSSQESLPSAPPTTRLYTRPDRASSPRRSAHLHFLRGDIIDLLDCSSSLTWRGRCRGRVGVFPPEYVQPLHH
ncbi:uncharacterized protein V6R79_019054 [Siganus canaliculatus]